MKAAFARFRQFRQLRAHRFDEVVIQPHLRQVGVGEIAVVVGFFFGAHRPRFAAFGVIQPRLLHYVAAGFERVNLARDFVFNRLFHEAERVDVFEFGAGAEFALAGAAHRHICIAAQRALLHVAVRDVEVSHQRMHLAQVGGGFGRRAHVGI